MIAPGIPTKTSHTGFELPVLGNGTWGLGGFFEPNASVEETTLALNGLEFAIGNGLRHIETAEVYAKGESERLVGRVVRNFKRDELIISSKILHTNLSYEAAINSVKGMLERLGTEYLDLCMIHGPNDEVPIEETLLALHHLRRDGFIRHIGLSNFNVDRLAKAEDVHAGLIEVASTHYNLLHQETAGREVLEYCQRTGKLFLAWRPIEKGAMLVNPPQIVIDVAQKYSATPGQVLLSWLMSQEQVVTIVKATNPKHIEENIGAAHLKLKSDDVTLLQEQYPERILNPERTFLK